MNWFNLKKNKCPECDGDFMKGLETYPVLTHSINGEIKDQMLAHPCGFKIRESKYRQIISNQITTEIEAEVESE